MEKIYINLIIQKEEYTIGIPINLLFFFNGLMKSTAKKGEFIVDFLDMDFLDIGQSLSPIVIDQKHLDVYIKECFEMLCEKYNNILVALFLSFYKKMLQEDDKGNIIQDTKLVLYTLLQYQDLIKTYLSTGVIGEKLIYILQHMQSINVHIDFETDDGINLIYVVPDIFSLISIDLNEIKKDKIQIKQCENCGKYFMPSKRSDEIYCNRIFRDQKTCKQIGYEEKEKKDPFKSLYTKARKTQHARIRYNIKNKPNYKQDHYEPWKKAAEKARDYFKASGDIEGFKKWIEENKNSF